jgi:glycosyltransferase involved in cell wall biosynthesis
MALNKYSFIGSIFKKIYTYFIKKGLKNYDLIFQVNPYQKEWMNKDYGIDKSKVKLLPNGINESIIIKTNKKTGNQLSIVYVGRVQKYKGIDQVIKALSKIKERNFIFNIVGKNAGDRERLENISKELGLEKKVVFWGEVSDRVKEEILERSEIFVFPSEWEAFGIAMLEGMAKGNSVISTKTEGGRYLVSKENGFLFDYGDINKLTFYLEKLIDDKKLRAKMGQENIKKAKNFLWKDISVDLEKEYKKLLN